jgi:hypothetical protein
MNSELRARRFRQNHLARLVKIAPITDYDSKNFNYQSKTYVKHQQDEKRLRVKGDVIVIPLVFYIFVMLACSLTYSNEYAVKPRIVFISREQKHRKRYSHFRSNTRDTVTKKKFLFNSITDNFHMVDLHNSSTTSTCVPIVEWQEYSFPTCNILHEFPLVNGEYINSGMNRDVWMLNHAHREYVAVKTLAMQHSFSRSMINEQRIDAIISERTTSSEFIVNIYAYCKSCSKMCIKYLGCSVNSPNPQQEVVVNF